MKWVTRLIRQRPLLRLCLVIAANLAIVLIAVGWMLTVRRSAYVELRIAESMTVVHAGLEGIYLIFAPPQSGLGRGPWLESNVTKREPDQVRPVIERNLSRLKHTVGVPGIRFWRTWRGEEIRDRVIVRTRFWLLLLAAIAFRVFLYKSNRITGDRTIS